MILSSSLRDLYVSAGALLSAMPVKRITCLSVNNIQISLEGVAVYYPDSFLPQPGKFNRRAEKGC